MGTRDNRGDKAKKGAISCRRVRPRRKAFQLTARYDAAVSNHLGGVPENPRLETHRRFPDTFTVQYEKLQDLRYGENPHQSAAFYRVRSKTPGLGDLRKHQGKELSYNNILDLNAALQIVSEFHEPASVIIKHNNPCGVAVSKEGILRAYELAYGCDRTSAFGGIVGFNRTVTKEAAESLNSIFLEAVIAPGYDKEALGLLSLKKNLRVLETCGVEAGAANRCAPDLDIKRVCGGVLLQTLDIESAADLKTVTRRGPDEMELEDLLFAWNVCKHVKSNAVIFAKGLRAVGIGAGQMSRIDSTRIAAIKAADAGLSIKGAVMASDAFFPFRDNVDMAAEHGITAIIQLNIKDEEVIKAADERDSHGIHHGGHFRH